MEAIRIGVVQSRWAGNRARQSALLHDLVAEAAGRGARLLCLPEFSLSPYFASVRDEANFEWAEPLHGGPSDRLFAELARRHRLHLIGSLFERDGEGRCWDTATLHDPTGTPVGFSRKVHIPEGAGYHESFYFEGTDHFPLHQVGALQVAVPTCYDQWFPETSRLCALQGAELLFYPTAIGSEPEAPDLDTSEAWQVVMRGQAIASGLYIAAANRVGVEGVTFYGRSFICDPMGRVVAEASRDGNEVIVADLDPALFAEWRRLFPLLRQRRPALYYGLVQER